MGRKKLHDTQGNIAKVQAAFVNLTMRHTRMAFKYQDPSLQHFLEAKAAKVYKNNPGIRGATNKTFTYVIPSLLEGRHKGEEWLNDTQYSVYSKLHTWIGGEHTEPFLPTVSGALVYGLVLVPLACTAWCFATLVCNLKRCLLFWHLYFAVTSICALGFAAYSGMDPFAALAVLDVSIYLFSQGLYALIVLIYGLLLLFACCCSRRGTGECFYRVAQVVLAAPMGVAYISLIWSPAMTDAMPQVDKLVAKLVGPYGLRATMWIPYALPSTIFLAVLWLERRCTRLAASHVTSKAEA